MSAPTYEQLAGLVAAATKGPWFAALERGCHGVIAQDLPESGNFVAIVGNSLDTPEREPMRFANAALMAMAPDLAAECLRLTAALAERDTTIAAQTAANMVLTEQVEAARVAFESISDAYGLVGEVARAWLAGKVGT